MPRTPADRTTAYAKAVASGREIAGPHVRDACARHLRDLKDGPKRGLTWDLDAANRLIQFFPDILRLTGGEHEGQPFHLHNWQAFVVGSLFGWKKGEYRRFRTAFIETGKGSGKSPLGAGIGVYMTVADGEPRAESYMAAVDKAQAAIPFRDAIAMIKLSDELREVFTLSGGEGKEWNAAHPQSGSWMRPLSSESQGRGKSGYRPHFILLDEVHEHPTGAMVEWLQKGIKGRRQPLTVMITNSGVDRTSVCFEYHTHGAAVAAGEIEHDQFFSYICGVDEDDDPFEDEIDEKLGYPRSWAKANPSIGVTFPVSYLQGEVDKSRGMPSTESVTRRLNFCQWVDAENPWIDGDLWRACEVDDLPELDEDFVVAMGLDLSSKRDLTAAARAKRVGDEVHAEVRFYTPKDTLKERERTDRVPYALWVDEGHLIAVPGRAVGYDFVVNDLGEWLTEDGSSLAFDQWRMEDFQSSMDDAGIDSWMYEGPDAPGGIGLRMVRHAQGFGGGASDSALWMPRSISELEDLILEGRLKVKRNPALTYCSASAVLEQDATGNKKWSKRKSLGRIDGIVALSMAVGAVMAEPEVETAGVYFMGDDNPPGGPTGDDDWW